MTGALGVAAAASAYAGIQMFGGADVNGSGVGVSTVVATQAAAAFAIVLAGLAVVAIVAAFAAHRSTAR